MLNFNLGPNPKKDAFLQGRSDGRYGYPANPGDWVWYARGSYEEGYAQGVKDREAEPHRYSVDLGQ